MKQDWIDGVRGALLAWYDVHARDLPWRRTRDPYKVWVSEVMLQQTRVETVLRYYDRFLERFPTSRALAQAEEDDVMAAWSGLGYYRRARLLQAGVREVVAHYGGRVPEDAAARRGLPGVGRYTAGAIGSIAFERAEPIVDGNVARVLCRLLAIEQPVESKEVQLRLWAGAERLVQGPRPGALNQALMELGATVCRKPTPRCEACPLQTSCLARAQGRAAELPLARVKAPPRELRWVGLLALRARPERDEVWLERGAGSLFGGLWNLPLGEGRGRLAARELVRRLELPGVLAARRHAQIEHVLTHRRLLVELWCLRDEEGREPGSPSPQLRAVALDAIERVGVSSLTRKALALLS